MICEGYCLIRDFDNCDRYLDKCGKLKNYMLGLKHFYKNEMMKTIEILNEVLNSEKDYLNCKLIDILRSRLCFVYYSMNKYEMLLT